MSKKKRTSSVIALEIGLVEMLVTTPINRITIQRLCDHSGVNRSTFYLHFHDIYELMNSIESQLKVNIKEMLDGTHDLQDKLNSLMNYIKEHSHFFRVFLDPKYEEQIRKYLDEAVLGAIKQEYTNVFDTIGDSKYIDQYILRGLQGITYTWVMSECDLASNEISTLMLSLISKTLN